MFRVVLVVCGALFLVPSASGQVGQQAYLKASNTGATDLIGFEVFVSGYTMVVGAPGESSSAVGVNGDQSDDSVPLSGAAYVFVKNGGRWSQQAYFKASHPGVSDLCGISVSVSGDTVVVGAVAEDSSATGVNGDPSDDSAVSSGAAYVFVRNGTTWSQQAYLKASNAEDSESFGASVSVSVSGDTLVVGAPEEDSSATGVDGEPVDNDTGNAGAVYLFNLGGWSDEGCALAGVSGDPVLTGAGLLADGTEGALDLTNAAPNAFCILWVSTSSTPTPFLGGTLKTVPILTQVLLATSPTGTIPLSFSWPSGVPAGFEFWVQYGIDDAAGPAGASLSNALRGTAL